MMGADIELQPMEVEVAKVTLLEGEADQFIGEFEFDHLPRINEQVTVPWAEDPDGVRIFIVGEVVHLADGVVDPDRGKGPLTILRYCEELS